MKRRSRAKRARKPKVGSARRKAPRRVAKRSLKKTRFSGKRKASSKKMASRSSPSSKPTRRRTSTSDSGRKPSQSMMFEPLEQVTVSCSNCSRQFNIVKLHGLSMEGMICQRCSIGEVESPEQ